MSFDDGSGAQLPGAVVHCAHAQQTIDEFLSRQGSVPERSRLARLFGLSPLDEHSAPWYWSALGMIEVRASLEGLPPEFRVFHGISIPMNDEVGPCGIDHLVIGPPGVFVVLARNHAKENVWVVRRDFVVSGHRLPYIRWAEAGIGFVERMLSAATGSGVDASAVVAVIDPAVLTVRSPPGDVAVIRAASLASWLSSRAPVLDVKRVEELAGAAEVPGTWSGADAPGEERFRAQRRRFDRVRREVGAARTVRSLWVIGIAMLLGTVLVTVITLPFLVAGL